MMKKFFFLMMAFMGSLYTSAQDSISVVKKDTVRHWSINGINTLTANQSSFSNWAAGGANSIGWVAGTHYNFAYENGRNLWENIFILGYGQSKTQGLDIRKTQDVLDISTNYGRKFSNSWFLSVGAGIITQFTPGHDYDNKNPIKSTATDRGYKQISGFMAPGYLNLGLGVTFKPSDNFSIMMYPSNARVTLVLDPDLQFAGNFGLKNDGDTTLFQLGFLTKVYYNQKIMENIHITNNLSVFANYLDHPDHMVINYLGAIDMKINKVVSTKFLVNILYDHNQIQRTQVRQTLGVGLVYNVSNGVKRSDNKHNRAWKY